MIALRIIDELPCRPVSQPKLFGYSIYQTQTTDVSVVQPVTQPNRQDMTPPAFLFLSSTMSISPGKALPNQTPQTQNHAAPPLRAVPAVSHPKHLKSAKVQRRQPAPQSLSHRAYRCHTQYLSSTSSTFLRNREERFSCGELQVPNAGGIKTNFPMWRFSRNSRCASAIFSKGNIFATSGFISPRSI